MVEVYVGRETAGEEDEAKKNEAEEAIGLASVQIVTATNAWAKYNEIK